MEAMHFKKPVISTDIPGNGVSWVNKHNESGIVVPPKSPKLLANAINDLLNNKLLYERLTNGAYARFERNFHIKRSAELYLNLYKEILDDIDEENTEEINKVKEQYIGNHI
jgi:glycosyltransferase involved in cell wall biosynthesis